jgi:hypothetical protein
MADGVATVTPQSLPEAAPDGSVVKQAPNKSADDLASGPDAEQRWREILDIDGAESAKEAQAVEERSAEQAAKREKASKAFAAKERREASPKVPQPKAVPDATGAEAPEAEIKPPAGEVGFYQDESGRWHRPGGEFASADEAAAAHEALTGEEVPLSPEEGQTPEITPPKPAKPAPEGFTPKAADGTPYDEWPDLSFDFNADGKEYKDVPLEKVVRMAQMGAYNERRDAENKQIRSGQSALEAQIAEGRRIIQEYDANVQRLFEDENYYLQSQGNYKTANSPEQRLQRLEQQRAYEQQQFQQQQVQQIAQNYISQAITPAVERLVNQYTEVPFEEALGELSLLTTHMTVNGLIPPQRLPEVQALVTNELGPWMESRHAARVGRTRTAETTARNQVAAEKVKVALAKRQLARASQPQGTIGSNYVAPKKLSRADDLEEALFGKAPE